MSNVMLSFLVFLLQGHTEPVENSLIADASRVRWMYILHLAVGLGQWDVDKWERVQRELVAGRAIEDMTELYAARDGVHALLFSSSGDLAPEGVLGGVIPRSTEAKSEIINSIERGYSRLAQVSALHHALWQKDKKAADEGDDSCRNCLDTGTLNELAGMMVGDPMNRVHPKSVLTLLSALGHGAIGRASTGSENVPENLAKDIANFRLTSKGLIDTASKRAAATVTQLAALLAITDALGKWKGELPLEIAERGAKLQNELRREIRTYQEDKDTSDMDGHRATLLRAAQSFIAELPPGQTEHGPGTSQLDIMMSLLGIAVDGCVRSTYLLGCNSCKPRLSFGACNRVRDQQTRKQRSLPCLGGF